MSFFFSKHYFRSTIGVSDGLDPDQMNNSTKTAVSVRPDLSPNCLQRLSADDTSRQRVNTLILFLLLYNAFTTLVFGENFLLILLAVKTKITKIMRQQNTVLNSVTQTLTLSMLASVSSKPAFGR